MSFRLIHGDSIDVMSKAKADSVHAVVCDPPYGIEFMGKDWDSAKMLGQATGVSGGFNRIEPGVHRPDMSKCDSRLFQEWCEAWGREALRVLKPGGHLLAFGGTRMWHRLAAGLEDAGFEIRDQIAWMYGSGFPKSHNVGKSVDKLLGTTDQRPVVGEQPDGMGAWNDYRHGDGKYPVDAQAPITGPGSSEAAQWDGWGTALKPAFEPIIVCRKPLSIPGKRAGTTKKANVAQNVLEHGAGAYNIDGCRIEGEPWKAHVATGLAKTKFFTDGEATLIEKTPHDGGRWPANAILDQEAADSLGDNARFFYVAKPAKSERAAGVADGSIHPTCKPITLMRYLVRLVTPPGGQVLDPFMGSGSTGIAAMLEGFKFIGIERELEYYEIAQQRIQHWTRQETPA